MERVFQIKAKLNRLIRTGQKAATPGFIYGYNYENTPVSVPEIESFESLHEIKLPEEFKSFLSIIGVGAGPGYGIFSLNRMQKEWEEWNAELGSGRMADKFELADKNAADMILQKKSDPKNYNYCHLKSVAGLLPISTDGCTYYEYIVLNGEQKGKVWSMEADGFGTLPAGAIHEAEFTFFDWYEKWLNDVLTENGIDINVAAEIDEPVSKDISWWQRIFGG
jgi:hypothetical protein